MRNDFSNEFKKRIYTSRGFNYKLDILFANGSTVILTDKDLSLSDCSISISTGSSSFPIGCCVGETLTASLLNIDDRWEDTNFYKAKIKVTISCNIGTEAVPNIESHILGTYTVVEPATYGSMININAVSGIYKLDKTYRPEFTTNQVTLRQLVADINYKFLQTTYTGGVFNNSEFTIDVVNIPDDKTGREVLGLVAMLAGGNAIMTSWKNTSANEEVRIVNFDNTLGTRAFDGGSFLFKESDLIDGGDFNFTDGDVIDGGDLDFSDYGSDNIVYMPLGSDLNNGTDEIKITGIKTTKTVKIIDPDTGEETDKVEDVERKISDDYVLSFENALIVGSEDSWASRMWEVMKLITPFRIFELTHTCNPLVEFADNIEYLDRKTRTFYSIATDITYAFKGSTIVKCNADSPSQLYAEYTSASASTMQAVESVKNDLINTRSDLSKRMDDMEVEIQNSDGQVVSIRPIEGGVEIENGRIVTTSSRMPTRPDDIEKTYIYYVGENGNYIKFQWDNALGIYSRIGDVSGVTYVTYTHNKKHLSQSSTIWRETVDTRSVSSDGGNTWNAAIDANGEAILQRLYTQEIVTSNLQMDTLTLGQVKNASGEVVDENRAIQVINKDGNPIMKIDKNGITMQSGTKIAWDDISYPSDLATSSDVEEVSNEVQTVSNNLETLDTNVSKSFSTLDDEVTQVSTNLDNFKQTSIKELSTIQKQTTSNSKEISNLDKAKDDIYVKLNQESARIDAIESNTGDLQPIYKKIKSTYDSESGSIPIPDFPIPPSIWVEDNAPQFIEVEVTNEDGTTETVVVDKYDGWQKTIPTRESYTDGFDFIFTATQFKAGDKITNSAVSQYLDTGQSTVITENTVTTAYVNALNVTADNINGKKIKVGGYNNGKGIIQLLDEDGLSAGQIDCEGIKMRAGLIDLGNFTVSNKGYMEAKSGYIGLSETSGMHIEKPITNNPAMSGTRWNLFAKNDGVSSKPNVAIGHGSVQCAWNDDSKSFGLKFGELAGQYTSTELNGAYTETNMAGHSNSVNFWNGGSGADYGYAVNNCGRGSKADAFPWTSYNHGYIRYSTNGTSVKSVSIANLVTLAYNSNFEKIVSKCGLTKI